MGYPTPSDYQEALQFPATAFPDPVLAAGTPAQGALGLPQPITGAFAAVFPVETTEGRFAVRCFVTRVADQRARYAAIAEHLGRADLSQTVAFDYQHEGIRVAGEVYPVLKMAWASGVPLTTFVERHLDRPDALRALAAAWRALLADLAAAGLAHGDLQHGNVFVREEEGTVRLALVDYDTMFVPALSGRKSPEVGHRNYQHPDRTEDDFDASLDHFAGLVVTTALTALAERPDLWTRFSTGENLLFQAGDFYDPDASPLFAALREIEAVRPLAEALRAACLLEPAAVPSLEEVLGGEVPEASGSRRRASWPAREAERSGFERWALPAVLVVVFAVVGLAAVGQGLLAVTFAVIAMGIFGWMGRRTYAERSAVRRRRRLDREAEVLGQWIADLEDSGQVLARDRRDFLASRDTQRAERVQELQDEVVQRHLRHHFVGELDGRDDIGHRAVVRLKSVGIRDAFHATPERVAEAPGLTTETRTRIGRWRSALAAEIEEDVPDDLSAAEQRRLDRQIERRLRQLDAERARIAAKIDVQQAEREAVRTQLVNVPEVTPGRYALFLLRLRPLPLPPSEISTAPILQQPSETIPPKPKSVVVADDAPDAAWWEEG